ncbi:hypothetical protein LINPERHAP1_LOCUS22575 [Linum perenne]
MKCKFCKHVSSGGIYRLKQHTVSNASVMLKCTKSTKEAQQACLKIFEVTTKRRRERWYESKVREMMSSFLLDKRRKKTFRFLVAQRLTN